MTDTAESKKSKPRGPTLVLFMCEPSPVRSNLDIFLFPVKPTACKTRELSIHYTVCNVQTVQLANSNKLSSSICLNFHTLKGITNYRLHSRMMKLQDKKELSINSDG